MTAKDRYGGTYCVSGRWQQTIAWSRSLLLSAFFGAETWRCRSGEDCAQSKWADKPETPISHRTSIMYYGNQKSIGY